MVTAAGAVPLLRGRRGTAAALAVALVADRALGEPPARWHPVAWFGRLMQAAERRWYRDGRAAGALHALAPTAGAAVLGRALAGRRRGSWRHSGLLAAVCYLSVAGRALEEAAAEVKAALDRHDLDAARICARSLVGRRTDASGPAELARAVVESVAENTVDAVTAPLLWGFVAGAPGVLAHRALNTLDAMVGHRSERYERFGWASARADDVANWVPARATAMIVAVLRPGRAGAIWRAVRHQAPCHPSPNAGVVEAAFAEALGLTLGGANDYAGRIEVRPALGSGPAACPGDIDRACRLARQVSAAFAAALLLVGIGSGR